MSKESRRAARLARESRRLGDPARQGTGGERTADTGPTGSPATGTARPVRPGRPTSGVGARAGRRERARLGPEPTFFQRYRTAIVTVAAIAIAAIAVGYVFIGSTSAGYTCGSQFSPSPTPPVSPGSSARLGYLETDMSNSHTVSVPQTYLLCPPASGTHHGDQPGVTGPIPARVYRPEDKVGPQNWIHNLEHGGMVVLYRSDSPGATAAGLQAFRDFAAALPPSPICQKATGQLSPVVARFDEMPHPFAALVWDRVLYMDTWDANLATQFYLTESERLDSQGAFVAPPEPQCPAPSQSAGSSTAPSAAPSGSTTPSSAPSTAPSVAAPSSSAAPSAAPS